MKRIVVCMDGTWQSLNQSSLTNIGVIAKSVAHKETLHDANGQPIVDAAGNPTYVHQTVIYTHGVGSSMGALAQRDLFGSISAGVNRMFGGAFGEGLEDGIVDTYLRLAFDYEEGDEIYIFGFSRGAFAARRLAGFISHAGIVSRRHTDKARDGFRLYNSQPDLNAPDNVKQEFAEATKQFRMLYGKGARNEDGTRRATDLVPPIRYLGVFDTVAQRGFGEVIASFTPWGNKHRYRFKNYNICKNVLAARHAVAVDENRVGFPVLLWDDVAEANTRAGRSAYGQKWFVGTHGDVGGGDGSKLAAAALKWVAEGARDAGLRFYATYGDDRSPLDEVLNDVGMAFDANITRTPWNKFWNPMNYPLRGRKIWTKRERPQLPDLSMYLDESVLQRAQCDYLKPRYRPEQLKPFRPLLKDWQPRK